MNQSRPFNTEDSCIGLTGIQSFASKEYWTHDERVMKWLKFGNYKTFDPVRVGILEVITSDTCIETVSYPL